MARLRDDFETKNFSFSMRIYGDELNVANVVLCDLQDKSVHLKLEEEDIIYLTAALLNAARTIRDERKNT